MRSCSGLRMARHSSSVFWTELPEEAMTPSSNPRPLLATRPRLRRISSGKFGTPKQDFDEIRHRLRGRASSVPHRALVETASTAASSSVSAKIDDADDEKPPDPSDPYSLGPKISDWAQDHHNLVMHGWNEMVYDQKNWIGLNTGSFLLRNTQWALDLLDAWAPMGPKGKVREEAGKVLTSFLKDRPVFEADDQSAMVYLLVTQRERWGEKVYLESAYYLHGYWGILVDRYEEMIENYHPGFGDHRWPLVTHFVGCKPCGKFGDYPVERCLKQMDRAFNFGDNQILQIYGFSHKSLASRRVKRIRNETDHPLEVKDDLGLLHPSFKAVQVTTAGDS